MNEVNREGQKGERGTRKEKDKEGKSRSSHLIDHIQLSHEMKQILKVVIIQVSLSKNYSTHMFFALFSVKLRLFQCLAGCVAGTALTERAASCGSTVPVNLHW